MTKYGGDDNASIEALPPYGRDFRLYLSGQAISVAGDRIATIALVFLVLHISKSFPPALALFYVARSLPTLVAGLIAGVVADSVDRERLMVGCDVARGCLLLAVPTLGAFSQWSLYPVVIALYALTLVFGTAARAALPDILPETRMLGANAILTSLQTGSDLAYAVSGFLIYWLGLDAPFYLDSVTFFFSALMISRMRLPVRAGGSMPDVQGFVRRIREGIVFLFNEPFLRWSSFAYAVAPVAIGIGFVLSPLYASATLAGSAGLIGPLKSGAFRFSLLEVCLGLGAIMGSPATTWLARRWSRGRIFAVGMTLSGLADASLAGISNIYLAAVALALSGLCTTLFIITGATLTQTLTPSEIRGRVMAARSTIIQTSITVGSAIAGALLLAVSVRTLWLVDGALVVTASLFIWLRADVRSQS